MFDVEDTSWSRAKIYLGKLSLDSIIFMFAIFLIFSPVLIL